MKPKKKPTTSRGEPTMPLGQTIGVIAGLLDERKALIVKVAYSSADTKEFDVVNDKIVEHLEQIKVELFELVKQSMLLREYASKDHILALGKAKQALDVVCDTPMRTTARGTLIAPHDAIRMMTALFEYLR